MSGSSKKLIAFREMLSRVSIGHDRQYTPLRNGRIDLEKNLFGKLDVANNFTGPFFEEVYISIFGGKKPSPQRYKGVQPDVLNGFGVGDVKACSLRHDMHFRPDQVEGYVQAGRQIGTDVFYAYFFHASNDGMDSEKTAEEKIKEFAKETVASLILPGSLLVGLCQLAVNSQDKFVRFSDRNKRGSWAYLSHEGLRFLFEKPLDFVKGVGLKDSLYTIERYFLGEFDVNGAKFDRIPILVVKSSSNEPLEVPERLLRTRDKSSLDSTMGLFDDSFDTPDSR